MEEIVLNCGSGKCAYVIIIVHFSDQSDLIF